MSIPDFHLLPFQLCEGGRQVSPCPFDKVKKVRFEQLRFFQGCKGDRGGGGIYNLTSEVTTMLSGILEGGDNT